MRSGALLSSWIPSEVDHPGHVLDSSTSEIAASSPPAVLVSRRGRPYSLREASAFLLERDSPSAASSSGHRPQVHITERQAGIEVGSQSSSLGRPFGRVTGSALTSFFKLDPKENYLVEWTECANDTGPTTPIHDAHYKELFLPGIILGLIGGAFYGVGARVRQKREEKQRASQAAAPAPAARRGDEASGSDVGSAVS
eukprot:TRINITY_DN24174_c0_g1_i2.p1 TRINITY_DN24174_c0_g1~~TRINITY_DN24174_c0_g1_i2.p1  ORF type:complete len:198 (+),score=17.64 TRINITY_DN24174_c0_g1_i2:138-731(+)